MSVKTTTIPIAGLSVEVHTKESSNADAAVVIFLLHGRMGSTKSKHVAPFTAKLLNYDGGSQEAGSTRQADLVVVTFV